MTHFLARFAQDESGAPAIEYALMAALIALVAATGMTTLGNGLNTFFNSVNTTLQGKVPSS